MTDRMIGTSSIPRRESGTGSLHLPDAVDEALGQPDDVVWFLDEDSGLMYVVPQDEVSIR